MNKKSIKRDKEFFLILLMQGASASEEGMCLIGECLLFLTKYSFLLTNTPLENIFLKRDLPNHGDMSTQKPNGARYLDPKYSRWIIVDPALGEYVPSAGKSNEADKLPGMGGIFNSVNLSLYHYAGNNPIKYVDPDGNETNKPTVLIVDMPGITDPDAKLSKTLLNLHILFELNLKTGVEGIVINVIDGSSVKSFKEGINDKKNNENMKSLIFIGGHSHIFEQEIIDKLNNNDINLDNTVQVYFATCELELNIKNISNKLGVPKENIHINTGSSWSDNSYDFLIKVLEGKNVEESYEEYKKANTELNENNNNEKQ